MVTYDPSSHEPGLKPAGVRVEYDARGQPRSAVVDVLFDDRAHSVTTVRIEYHIDRESAKLWRFIEPVPITRAHFQALPVATRQLKRLRCIDDIERAEKTFGDALMEGYRRSSSD